MIDDSLDADIAAAIAGVDTTAPATDAPAIADTSPAPDAPKAEGDDRPRDEHGRFKPKDETAEAPKAEAPKVEGAAPAAPVASQPAPEAAKPAPIPPPLSWDGKGKIEWQRLPAAIQKNLADNFAQLDQTKARLESLDAAIGPQRAQALAATYGSTENAIRQLLAMSDMASQDAPGFIRWFSQQRGIDLSQLVGQGAAPGEEPAQPHPLEMEVRQLRDQLQSFVQQQQQGAQAQVNSLIETFAADPAHPYFNDVEPHIRALLRDVVTTGSPQERLQKAYDMATWTHPESRETRIAQERERLAAEEAARVQQARNASVSISGSPAGSKVPTDEPDDDLEAVIRKAQARAS